MPASSGHLHHREAIEKVGEKRLLASLQGMEGTTEGIDRFEHGGSFISKRESLRSHDRTEGRWREGNGSFRGRGWDDRENEGRNARGARDGYCGDGLNSEAWRSTYWRRARPPGNGGELRSTLEAKRQAKD